MLSAMTDGNWKRAYGIFYTGTQGETPDTAKERPTKYRAGYRPYQGFRKMRAAPPRPAVSEDRLCDTLLSPPALRSARERLLALLDPRR